MKTAIALLIGFSLSASFALAGGGGGLHFDNKVEEVKKAECSAGANLLTFSDITWRDPEIGLFMSTNLVIETPGQAPKTFFVWAQSKLQGLNRTGELHWEKVAMIDSARGTWTYFDLDVNFSTGKGTLAGASYVGNQKFSDPFLSLQLSGCTLAR